MKVTEISKMVSAQWKNLSDAQRAPYLAKSDIDKKRYARERDAYKQQQVEFERLSEELYPDPNKPPPEIPRPPAPDKPRGRTSCYMYFNNEARPVLAKKHPDLKVTDIAKLVSAQWRELTDAQKAPYMAKSDIDKIRWSAEYKKYKKKMEAYDKLILELFPPKPKKKKKKKKKEKKQKRLVDVMEKPKALPMLINKVVRVALSATEESGWQYFFVLTYIPDLQWCRLAPMHPCGIFGDEKNGIARGRLRWKLVEEGRALELDISAKRCTIVKTRVMRGTPNADMEGGCLFFIFFAFPRLFFFITSCIDRLPSKLHPSYNHTQSGTSFRTHPQNFSVWVVAFTKVWRLSCSRHFLAQCQARRHQAVPLLPQRLVPRRWY